jgi:hypothetical protein
LQVSLIHKEQFEPLDRKQGFPSFYGRRRQLGSSRFLPRAAGQPQLLAGRLDQRRQKERREIDDDLAERLRRRAEPLAS